MEIVPSFASLLPSLIAIILALATRQIFVAMFAGIWAGAWLVDGASIYDIFGSLIHTIDIYILQAIVPENGDSSHFAVVMFSLMTGGMVGIISRNGGMSGLVQSLKRIAKGRRSGQAVSAGLGGAIFFDDYCSALIVGNTMRPLTDSLRISREKLAFIVDSTAAPVSSIAIISTWIGVQASLLDSSIPNLNIKANGFELVMASIAYSFYPILLLCFLGVMIFSNRDFGSMLKAERKAVAKHDDNAAIRSLIDFSPASHHDLFKPQTKPYLLNAIIPLICYLGGTIWGLFQTGEGAGLRNIIGSSDPFSALLWGALFGLIAAIIMSVSTKQQTISQTMEALEAGMQPMLLAVMILTFSWAIASVNTDLHTAEYIISNISDKIAPLWLPVIIFLIAAATSFATGSSWSAMGILVPLAVPLSYNVLITSGVADIATNPIFLCSIASILTGAVWGDHCSPISNTTILSSIACSCPHIDHVKTQLPYALTVAGVSAFCGLLIGAGVPWWSATLCGIMIIIVIFKIYGKQPY